MDDELQQLEAELARLHPTAPSPRVVAGLQRTLAVPDAPPTQGQSSRLYWWWAAALPAAAAITLMLVYFSGSRLARPASPASAVATGVTSRSSGEGAMKPVSAENVLVSASDEGLVTLDDGTPARRERLRYVDTIIWRNPRTNASLTWSVPREEIRVVPVVFQ